MKASSEDLRYGFINGRVRALENTLLDRQRYERLVRAGGVQELRSLLADTVYGRYLSEDSSVSMERALVLVAADNYGLVSQYCSDQWLLRVLSLRIDFYNIKTTVKDRIAGRESEPDKLQRGGDWSGERLKALAAGNEETEPAAVREAVAEVIKAAAEEPETVPVLLDAALDRVEQEEQLRLATGSRFVLEYLGIHADVENIRTLVRTKVFGEEKALFGRAFLPGGTLTLEQLTEIWNEELDAVPGRLRVTPYARLAEEGIAGVRQGTMLKQERLCREHRLLHLLDSRYMTFGYEPLFAYYLFRENEIANLRQLLAAKEAGLQESLCRETVAHVG
jgi:V/A-type H+-transporting ATPase subunit C